MSDDKNQIWKIIQSINQIWTKTKNISDLENYFHDNMSAIVNKKKNRLNGKRDCVEHWRKCSEKTIYSWKEFDEEINITNNDFAIVTYFFEIMLERNGEKITSNSSDSFCLVKEDGVWRVIFAVV